MGYSIQPLTSGSLQWDKLGSNNPYALGGSTLPFDYGAQLPYAMGSTGMSSPTPAYSTPAIAAPVTPVAAQAGQANVTGADAADVGWFGKNMGTITDISKVIGGFGQVWAGLQANKIAKDSLNFQKESYATNLGNQIKAYNLSLDDRIRARYAQNERSSAEADATIAANKM